ncbi:hypothetical protein MICAD_40013 [Microcystis aeruginosa PCC 7941]|nr:hypothetical protein MICAD_40013 [Microcystis aeruginosa PCC 7941]
MNLAVVTDNRLVISFITQSTLPHFVNLKDRVLFHLDWILSTTFYKT